MSGFIEVRDEETGRLLFTFDPEQDIIRVVDKHRKLDATVVLDDYRKEQPRREEEDRLRPVV